MKKITLSFLASILFLSFSYSQIYTSGLVNVENPSFPGVTVNSVQIDINVTSNLVTATVIGPDNSWLAFGFDTSNMTEDRDVFIFDGTNLTDRTFQGLGVVPEEDTNLGEDDNWTMTSNTTSGGMRTIVATRTRIATDGIDFTFPSDQSSFDIVTAHGDDEFTLNYHGFPNKGTEELVFTTLSTDSFQINDFSVSPNPARSNLNVVLPSTIQNSVVNIYDVLGKRIFSDVMMNSHTKSIDVSAWKSGVYLIKVSNDKSTKTKRFVKQ